MRTRRIETMGEVRRLPSEETKALMGEVARRPVRDVIADKLAALISSGVLSVGDALPGERELAAALSVSRETVRGAIGILAAHGILRVAQGARTTVATSDVGPLATPTPLSGFDGPYGLEDVHEARILVERQIAGSAAHRIDAEALGRLRASLAAQEACGDDPVRFLLCDREFHTTLYRAGGNEVLFELASSLYNYLLDHRRRIVARPGTISASLSDHRAIVEALAAGDAAAVRAAVCAHATRIYETTRAFLDAASDRAS